MEDKVADREFEEWRTRNKSAIGSSRTLKALTGEWMAAAQAAKYSYNFDWLGLPIIQYPQDIVAMQEIVWSLKPDLIIETGVARGGSAVFYASLLELIAICSGQQGEVVAVDIDVRPHNWEAIKRHPLSRRITLIEGSSISAPVIEKVRDSASGKSCVLVCLDSNHTHDHVLAELRAYAPLVTPGSFVVVFDTVIEDLPADGFPDRPWGRGDNPKTAVHQFLSECGDFEIAHEIHDKLLISVAPDGFLRRNL